MYLGFITYNKAKHLMIVTISPPPPQPAVLTPEPTQGQSVGQAEGSLVQQAGDPPPSQGALPSTGDEGSSCHVGTGVTYTR